MYRAASILGQHRSMVNLFVFLEISDWLCHPVTILFKMKAGMQNDPDPGLNSETKPENFKPRTQIQPEFKPETGISEPDFFL
jgi:hypothetical protein